MAYIPVLWNQMQHDVDDMFHLMDPWLYGAPVHSVSRRRPRRHETSLADKKWTFGVKIGDFDPEHVKVKVENGKVEIVAKYQEGNEEWGDTVERRRMVKIPENVDADKIHSVLRSDGALMLEAPYRVSEEHTLAVTPLEGGALVPTEGKCNLMKFSVGNFSPNEVKISCKDGVLTAQGKHQRSEDGHEIQETFFRQMTMPDSVDVGDVECFMDKDGFITIRAPTVGDDDDI